MGSIFRTEGLSAGYGRKVVLSGAEITAERYRPLGVRAVYEEIRAGQVFPVLP